jgi:PhoPQ-activated pathogenicity-related protein
MLRLLACALLLGAASARADLFKYVQKPDDSFAWKIAKKTDTKDGTLWQIELTSQTWQKIPWTHDLVVVLPKDTKPTATMLLFNTGGRANAANMLLQLQLAKRIQAPVAFLFGIPKQPLFEGKREDALIAETFVRYLDTKDADWPLLFPMVKSLVKAMDALQAFAKEEWKHELTGFVVSGASKRGWTSWLTGAADKRVKAIMPLVIDTLNFQKQMPYQLKSYGAYSDQIKDYTERKLVPLPDSEDARRLWAWVDPWVHRDRLTMPKLILNGTNDPYWTQDALNLYWDDLKGPKWISYVPNAGHGLEEVLPDGTKNRDRAVAVMAAFAGMIIHDRKPPEINWTIKDNTIQVVANPMPKEFRVWETSAKTRDFRKSTWTSVRLKPDEKATLVIERPTSGSKAFFVEVAYGEGEQSYAFSTQIQILDAPKAEKGGK